MFGTLLLATLVLSAPAPPAQELPTYFIKFHQERTLFGSNEPVLVVVRLGNQLEGIIKARKFPKILESLELRQGDQIIERDPKFSSKDLFGKVASIEYGAHQDFRINLVKYWPAARKGGVYRLTYKDPHFSLEAKPISIVEIPVPDLNAQFRIKTSMGDFTVELDPIQAPNHSRNFALLVAMQFYKDMIFHRIENGMLIQGGDPIGDGTGGSGFPLDLERSPFMHHKKYTLGMARKRELDSGDSQFFINLRDIKDFDDAYTVFGKVVDGFDVVDRIGAVQTTGPNGNPPSRPLENVFLFQIEAQPKAKAP